MAFRQLRSYRERIPSREENTVFSLSRGNDIVIFPFLKPPAYRVFEEAAKRILCTVF